MDLSLAEVAVKLAEHHRFVVTAHISPDADAVASSCGLAWGLTLLGKDVVVYLHDPIPRKLLPLVRNVEVVAKVEEIPWQPDAVVVLDTATKRRIGSAADALLSLTTESFNIDHHVSNEKFAKFNAIVAESSSSAELALQLLVTLKGEIPPDLAGLLLAGLVDDTGSFRYSTTTPESFAHASYLLSLGASPNAVAEQLYFTTPRKVVALRQRALQNLRFSNGGEVAMLHVDSQTLAEVGALSEDTEGLIDEARSIEGVVVAIFIRQLASGWKASLRSKDSRVDVNKIAAVFGGGGHKLASGCTLSGSLAEVEAQLLAEVSRVLAIRNSGN